MLKNGGLTQFMNACKKGHRKLSNYLTLSWILKIYADWLHLWMLAKKDIKKLSNYLKLASLAILSLYKFILEKFENYGEHYLCKDRPWLPPRLPNAGLERPQRPLGQWAVVLQRVVESREAENPILVFEVLPEIRNWCDPLGPVKHWIHVYRCAIISHLFSLEWMFK